MARGKIILPYIRRLFESKKSLVVTKKRVEQLRSEILPDKEIMEDYQMRFDSEMQVR